MTPQKAGFFSGKILKGGEKIMNNIEEINPIVQREYDQLSDSLKPGEVLLPVRMREVLYNNYRSIGESEPAQRGTVYPLVDAEIITIDEWVKGEKPSTIIVDQKEGLRRMQRLQKDEIMPVGMDDTVLHKMF